MAEGGELTPGSSITHKAFDSKSEKALFIKRLSSFSNWPVSAAKGLTPSDLASAGFYYTTYKDEVKCDYCELEYSDWKDDDVPLRIHRLKCPECPFVVHALEDDSDLEIDGEAGDEEQYEEVDLAEFSKKVKAAKEIKKLRASKDITAIKRDSQEMRTQLMCKHCKLQKIQTLFLPCRHLVSCESCADKVDYCFYCSTRIMGTVKTYVT